MKMIFLMLSLLICSLTGFTQRVDMLTSSQLLERFKNGRDTTYVINFWATWCVPCVKELPIFEKVKQVSFDKPVKVILVSTDEGKKSKQAIAGYVSRLQLTDELYQMNESPQVYIHRIDKKWTGALPATLVITGDGKRHFYNQAINYNKLLAAIQPSEKK